MTWLQCNLLAATELAVVSCGISANPVSSWYILVHWGLQTWLWLPEHQAGGGEMLLEAVPRCRNRVGQEPPLTCLP